MVDDKAKSSNFSLYPKHIEKIEKYANETDQDKSTALQNIINDFFKNRTKSIRQYLIYYFIVPLTFGALALGTAIYTTNMVTILWNKGIYFNELYVLNRFYTVVGFLTIGLMIAGLYILRLRVKRKEGWTW